MRYCVGFMFSEDWERVLLMRKLKPKWQEGLLNGIGGKVEENESPQFAMIRETIEETGITSPAQWKQFCVIKGPSYELTCFYSQDENLQRARNMEAERLGIYETWRIRIQDEETVSNLPWLISLALDQARGKPGPWKAEVFYCKDME